MSIPSPVVALSHPQAPRSSPEPPRQTLTTLPVSSIAPNPLQPRKTFNDAAMQELIASVKTYGVVQPVVVTKSLSGYRLVVGERRWRAAQAAGLSLIPAVVCDYAEVEAMQIALVENIQRQDLNPIEEAQAMHFLLKEYHMTQETLAVRLGKSRPALSNTLRLLQLPRAIQLDLVGGEMTAGHGRALLGLEDQALQLKVWQKVRAAALSVRQTETLVRRLMEKPTRKPAASRTSDELLDVQQDLERSLQAGVRIRARGKKGGRIEVHYTSPEELERLLGLLSRVGRAPSQRRVEFELL